MGSMKRVLWPDAMDYVRELPSRLGSLGSLFGSQRQTGGSGSPTPTDGVTNLPQRQMEGQEKKQELIKATDSSSLAASTSTSGQLVVPIPAKPKMVISVNSKAEMLKKTRKLVKRLLTSSSGMVKLLETEKLSQHLIDFPYCADEATKEGAVRYLLLSRDKCRDTAFKGKANKCLALLGYIPPPKGAGIRMLAMDGGGTRGMMTLELLEALEQLSGGRKITEMFDYIIGVSTGSIIASLLTGANFNIQDCKEIYKQLSAKLFDQSRVWGTTGLLWSHSYYDTKVWASLLQQSVGAEKRVVDTAEEISCPKVAFVSTIVNLPKTESFLFRNYNLPASRQSVFLGSTKYKIWQAVQASSAAPGYFEETQLDGYIHQDGGVLINNPTGLGLHECKLLWPDTPVQCIVSLGTGRPPSTVHLPASTSTKTAALSSSSLREKVAKFVDSATDTEKVHALLSDLLPPSTYFRFNPYMSHSYTLDENRPEYLTQMATDARMYIRKNQQKLEMTVEQLTKEKTMYYRFRDWLRYRRAISAPVLQKRSDWLNGSEKILSAPPSATKVN